MRHFPLSRGFPIFGTVETRCQSVLAERTNQFLKLFSPGETTSFTPEEYWFGRVWHWPCIVAELSGKSLAPTNQAKPNQNEKTTVNRRPHGRRRHELDFICQRPSRMLSSVPSLGLLVPQLLLPIR